MSCENGYQIWSQRYDREMKDVFDTRDEIIGGGFAMFRKLRQEPPVERLRRHLQAADGSAFTA